MLHENVYSAVTWDHTDEREHGVYRKMINLKTHKYNSSSKIVFLFETLSSVKCIQLTQDPTGYFPNRDAEFRVL